MALVVFGSSPDATEQALLETMDDALRGAFLSSAIFNCSAFVPPHGLLLYFQQLHILSCRDLIYAYAPFAEKIGSGSPTSADILTFILMGSDFVIWNASIVTATHTLTHIHNRVLGRFSMLLNYCLAAERTISSTTVVDEDTPLTSEKNENCEAKFTRYYGAMLQASHLGTTALLGKLHRGILSRSFPVVSLKTVHSQTEDKVSVELKGFDEHLRPNKKQRAAAVSNSVMFVQKLRLLLDSIVFVSAIIPAPSDKWKGDPTFGTVQGVRLQATPASVLPYLDFWTARAQQPGVSVEQLSMLEKEMRLLWIDKFRNFTQLATCMLDSISENKGLVAAELKAPRLQDLMDPKTGISKNKFQGKPGQVKPGKLDFSALPGFDPSISTVKVDKAGKAICKHYNIQSGCRFGDACSGAHVCDVSVGGKACGAKSHIRIGHKAALAGGSGEKE